MSSQFCNVSLSGILTRDPLLRQYDSGAKKCSLNIAINTSFTKQNGDSGKNVCYMDADIWGEKGVEYSQSLRKGDQVRMDGSLRYEKWIDKKDGINRSCHKVIPTNVTVIKTSNEVNTVHEQSSTNHMLDLEEERVLQKLEETRQEILQQRELRAKPVFDTDKASNQYKQAPAKFGDELPF
jgi:single-strand DNA-binding protein